MSLVEEVAAVLAEVTARTNNVQTERLIHMTEAMAAHTKADAEAFAVLGEQIVEINKDVKSLLNARVYASGVGKTLSVMGGVILTLVAALLALFKFR